MAKSSFEVFRDAMAEQSLEMLGDAKARRGSVLRRQGEAFKRIAGAEKSNVRPRQRIEAFCGGKAKKRQAEAKYRL